jgi:hypothetical protein
MRVLLGALLAMALTGLLSAVGAQDGDRRAPGGERAEESGPSLDDLRRQIEQGSRSDSGGGPTLPSGGSPAGGVLDALKGRPAAAPSGPPPADVSGFSGGGSGPPAPAASATKPFFLDVLAPPQIVFNGVPPAPCVMPSAAAPVGPGTPVASPPGAPGNNQAYVCVSGAAFDSKSKIELRAAPSPYLRQTSYSAGNPAQAVYLFAAPGPGKYRLVFEARMGGESQSKDVEIEVRQAEGASAKVNLEVVAPREIVLGTRSPGCAAVRPGQVPICVTATSFDRLSQVVIEAPARRDLARVSLTPGNPAQAVYAFTPPGVGTYELPFGGRLGNDLESKTVTIEVKAAGSPAGAPSLSGGGGLGGGLGGGGAAGGGTPAERPTLRLTRTDLLTVRADASVGGNQEVCLQPGSGDLAGAPPRVCGRGAATYTYRVSDARVRADRPQRSYSPLCKRFSVVVVAVSAGLQEVQSQEISINGCWLFTAVGGSSALTLQRVVDCSESTCGGGK